MLFNFIFSILTAFLCCFFFRKFSKTIGLLDIPDGVRKIHKGSIPLGGGLSIALTLLICCFVFIELNDFFTILLISTLLLLLVGLIDDFISLPISIRLISQILVSWLVIIFSEIYVQDLGDIFGLGNIYLGQLGIPLTIFMIVGVSNAFNMLDGMDGLVSLVAFIAVLFISIICFINGVDFSWAIALLGALGVFFLFNIGILGKRFQMFLGDSGAMTIGYFLAWILVFYSQEPTKILSPVSATWIILIPLIDAISAFYRRLRLGERIFVGDRNHIHYILLERGFSETSVLLIFLLISLFSCIVALLSGIFIFQESYLFYGFLTLWVIYLLLIKYPREKRKKYK